MNAKNVMKFLATVIVAMTLTASAAAQDTHKSSNFQGPKANKGFVTHSDRGGKSILTLSDEFVVPDTPDPHWRVVDSDGNTYDLDKLKKKALIGDKYQKEVTVPSYVKNVKKVIIWCAWAEANLGEASFETAVQ